MSSIIPHHNIVEISAGYGGRKYPKKYRYIRLKYLFSFPPLTKTNPSWTTRPYCYYYYYNYYVCPFRKLAKIVSLLVTCCVCFFIIFNFYNPSIKEHNNNGTDWPWPIEWGDEINSHDIHPPSSQRTPIKNGTMNKMSKFKRDYVMKSAIDEISHNFNIRFHPPNSWITVHLKKFLYSKTTDRFSKIYVYSAYCDMLALVTDGAGGIFTGIKLVALTKTSRSAKLLESPTKPLHLRIVLSFVIHVWENFTGWCVYLLSRLSNRANIQHPWCQVLIFDASFTQSPKPILKSYFTRAYMQELPENHGHDWTASIYYCPLQDDLFKFQSDIPGNDARAKISNNRVLTKFPIGVRLTSQSLNELTDYMGPPPDKLTSDNNNPSASHRKIGWKKKFKGGLSVYDKSTVLPVFHKVIYPNTRLQRFRRYSTHAPTAFENQTTVKLHSSPLSIHQQMEWSSFQHLIDYQIALEASVPKRFSYPEKPGNRDIEVISVCIPPLFGPLNNTFFTTNFVQTMEWLNLNKVSDISLYRIPFYYDGDKSTRKEITLKGKRLLLENGGRLKVSNVNVDGIIRYYSNRTRSEYFKPRVHLKPWVLPSELAAESPQSSIHYYAQVANIQDCLFQNGNGVADLVLFHDFDEFLFSAPQGNSNFVGLFQNLSRNEAATSGRYHKRRPFRIPRDKVCGYVFPSIYMDIFDSGKMATVSNDKKFSLATVSYSSPYESFVVPLRDFSMALSDFFPHGIRSKYAVYPDRLLTIGIHEPHLDIGFFTKWLFGPRGLFSGGWSRHRLKRKRLINNLCTDGFHFVPNEMAYLRHFSPSIDAQTVVQLSSSGVRISNQTNNMKHLPKLVESRADSLALNMLTSLQGQ